MFPEVWCVCVCVCVCLCFFCSVHAAQSLRPFRGWSRCRTRTRLQKQQYTQTVTQYKAKVTTSKSKATHNTITTAATTMAQGSAAEPAAAAPAVAAEMARMGGGLRTMGMSNYSGQSANPTQKVMSPANSSTDAREHAILAQQELAARDALERILATPSAFGSPSGLIRPRSQSPFVAATSPYLSTRKTTTPVNAAAYTDFDWRFTGVVVLRVDK